MTININNQVASSNAASEVLGAKLAKNQQELEGEMALQLIQSVAPQNPSTPTGNIGNHINIKV